MIKYFNRQRLFIVLFPLIILTFLSLNLIKPEIKRISKNVQKLQEKQKILLQLSQKREYLGKLKKEEVKIDQALKKAQEALPEKEEVPNFLVEMEKATKETANLLKTTTLSKGEQKQVETEQEVAKEKGKEQPKGISSLSFSLTISGNFKSLLDYLGFLETLSRFSTISSLNIKAAPDNKIETNISGQIYYKKGEK